MLRDSRTSIHFGVNFIFAPQPVLDQPHFLDFQGKLASERILFTAATRPAPGVLILQRQVPSLEVRILQPGPPLGQLTIVAAEPRRAIDEFVDESKSICESFAAAWPGDLQIIQCDCTIRALYDVAADHAFKYLWEERLNCEESELSAFGRAVHGGGLRFVLPAPDTDPGTPNIEIKIESFLADPRKLYVDVAMTWNNQALSPTLDPEPLLRETERYATHEVHAFIAGEHP